MTDNIIGFRFRADAKSFIRIPYKSTTVVINFIFYQNNNVGYQLKYLYPLKITCILISNIWKTYIQYNYQVII